MCGLCGLKCRFSVAKTAEGTVVAPDAELLVNAAKHVHNMVLNHMCPVVDSAADLRVSLAITPTAQFAEVDGTRVYAEYPLTDERMSAWLRRQLVQDEGPFGSVQSVQNPVVHDEREQIRFDC